MSTAVATKTHYSPEDLLTFFRSLSPSCRFLLFALYADASPAGARAFVVRCETSFRRAGGPYWARSHGTGLMKTFSSLGLS